MSRTRHARPSNELRALRDALSRMAERCVHAEARATMAEAEIGTLKQNVAMHQENDREQKRTIKDWWVTFWTEKGVKPEVLVQARMTYWQESRAEAVKAVYRGKCYYSHPDPAAMPGGMYIELPDHEP